MVSYSVGECANSLIMNSLFGFAMLYYTDALGLKHSYAGIAMSLALFLDDKKLSQTVRELVAQVPWGHHANVLTRVTDPAARLYYLRATSKFGWSRNVLLNQIKAKGYERAVSEKRVHNFALDLAPLTPRTDFLYCDQYEM